MHFTTLLTAAAAIIGASATNTITFKSLDTTDRTIFFTANPGGAAIPQTRVKGGATVTTNIPSGWAGNYFSVSDGAPYKPGMLGEVAFQAWGGISYFDVSAIVNPTDFVGVMEMYPADEPNTPTSGCAVWPCANAYWASDDVQTKGFSGEALITTLGGSGKQRRDFSDEEVASWENFPRGAVTDKMWMPRQ